MIRAVRNSTRASIFYQLARKPESTATEISRNLGEDVDVVYYHLKLLKKAGLVSKPRVVAQKNYVEKYYSLRSDFKEKFLRSVGQIEAKKRKLSADEFREYLLAGLSVIHSILAGSMKMVEKADSKTIENLRDERNIAFKIIFCSEERYKQLLDKLWEIAKNSMFETFDPVTKEHVITIVAIPKLDENAI